MEISVDSIKELREMTSCGVIECKKALQEANGDMVKAKEILQRRGLEIAAKKGSRLAKEGRIEAYIHPGSKIGVLVEVNCETDFVAKNEDFCKFTKDLAMQIAAAHPKYIKREDVSEDVLKEQDDRETFIKEKCLVEQPFVKDPKKTIQDCINALIASIGENIYISRFARYKVNEIE
ncbi:MAG TPA: translation elongation factor Ts [Candidatus Omnitrophica bacterium]|nr:MAG: translation elongation factor Ts [Omnitrophica WOR_2 bacterium GWA2_45_18]OGX18916.1 MAG: translation elongation factor Ts [Omnitrophica WOR_2 bacterium GWC2_45_7]HBO97222.1 translation elongation factor Ts [Candidatus Omnitrophota bacterium]HBR15147.1 translation elongation factor Ts [Candidatus Omnitrophota bacterium]